MQTWKFDTRGHVAAQIDAWLATHHIAEVHTEPNNNQDQDLIIETDAGTRCIFEIKKEDLTPSIAGKYYKNADVLPTSLLIQLRDKYLPVAADYKAVLACNGLKQPGATWEYGEKDYRLLASLMNQFPTIRCHIFQSMDALFEKAYLLAATVPAPLTPHSPVYRNFADEPDKLAAMLRLFPGMTQERIAELYQLLINNHITINARYISQITEKIRFQPEMYDAFWQKFALFWELGTDPATLATDPKGVVRGKDEIAAEKAARAEKRAAKKEGISHENEP